MGFFSCASSDFCGRSQLALPQCNPPATTSISGQLLAASPSVTLALCPPDMSQWFMASSEDTREDGNLLHQWHCVSTFYPSCWKPLLITPVDDCTRGRICASHSAGSTHPQAGLVQRFLLTAVPTVLPQPDAL